MKNLPILSVPSIPPPSPLEKTGEEKVIKVPSNSLRQCKKIAKKVLKVLPKEYHKGKFLKPIMVRIDFGCCQGNSLNSLKYFVNEVELQTAGLYSNFTKYSIIPKLAKLFVKRAEVLTGKKINLKKKSKKKKIKKIFKGVLIFIRITIINFYSPCRRHHRHPPAGPARP